MAERRRFAPRVVSLLASARMLAIRAGMGDHRFTGIWFVLIKGRLFVRPWYDSASGWRQALLEDPRGTILVGKREIAVRARSARGERLFDAMDRAYAEKYATPASRKWVRGFKLPSRRRTTMELTPR